MARYAAAWFLCLFSGSALGSSGAGRASARLAPGLPVPAQLTPGAAAFAEQGAVASAFKGLSPQDRASLRQAFDDFALKRGLAGVDYGERMMGQVVEAGLSLVNGYGPADRIVAVGRSPLAALEAAQILDPASSRYAAAPFTSGGGAPSPRGLSRFRGLLAGAGLSPRAIVDRPGATVLADYVRSGSSLKSFISHIQDWGREEGVEGLESRLAVHAFMDARDDHVIGWERLFGSHSVLPPEWRRSLEPYLLGLLGPRFPGHPVKLHLVDGELGRALADGAFKPFFGSRFRAEDWGKASAAPHAGGGALLRFRLLEFLESRSRSPR